MGFLDNSGDIILDAILTDEGRDRMATAGTPFKITKFALGDDEINYAQWDGSNTGGSAYYDLEILQTPVFEATSRSINFGLLATMPSDMLFMPEIKMNEKGLLDSIKSYNNMYWVLDTSKDTQTLTMSQLLDANSIEHMLGKGVANAKYCAFETGINVDFNSVPMGTKANREDYLVAKRLINKSFLCYYDNRFFSSVMGVNSKGTFSNSAKNHSLDANIALAAGTRLARGTTSGMDNYSAARLGAIADKIYYYGEGTETESTLSVLGGPRDAFGVFSGIIQTGMSAQYSLYGGNSTLNDSDGASQSYVFIDTAVVIVGAQTGTQITIPIRIARLA